MVLSEEEKETPKQDIEECPYDLPQTAILKVEGLKSHAAALTSLLANQYSETFLDYTNESNQDKILQLRSKLTKSFESINDYDSVVLKDSSGRILEESDIDTLKSEDEYIHNKELIRIYKLDAVRRWVAESEDDSVVNELQKNFRSQCAIASASIFDLPDYHQALGFLISFLNLFTTPYETLQATVALGRSSKHSFEYFRGQSRAYIRDARVAEELLDEDVKDFLSKKGIALETCLARWFVSLSANTLPWTCSINYISNYCKHGMTFVFKYIIFFVKEYKETILASKSLESIFGLFNLADESESGLAHEIIRNECGENGRINAVINKAAESASTNTTDGFNEKINRLRQEKEQELIEQDAKRKKFEDHVVFDEIVFSDEE